MGGGTAPERLRWAVETMAVDPADRLLEIGCGSGVAVSLVCERLRTGTITAIDRSPKAIEAATRRNQAHIAAGRAELRTLAIEDAVPGGLPEHRYDKVFAVNVNLFWTRTPTAELALIRRLLAPGGAVYLFYEPPSADRADQLAGALPRVLADHGFASTTRTRTTAASTVLLCVRAGPG
jgi:trans-aconitate methyltransferase